MQDTNDPDPLPADPAWAACLERTRSAVLNVLVGVGLTIAIGGWLLRGRAEAGPAPEAAMAPRVVDGRTPRAGRRELLVRRSGKTACRCRLIPADRQATFYRSHVLAASIAALAAPLGIVYGWWIDPRLAAVIPFWVVPLALGFLAIPRAHELD